MSAELSIATIRASIEKGMIAIARCARCGAEHAFPTPSCFECGSTESHLAHHHGEGSVFSWVVNHHAFGDDQKEIPYTVLLVELDGGARVYGRLADDAATRSRLAGGMRLRLDPDATIAAGHLVFDAEISRSAEGDKRRQEVPHKTCYNVICEVARRRREHPAFELIGLQSVTYGTLVDRIDRCAAFLEGKGLEPGDRLAVMSNNRVELLELWLACSRIGAVFVPFNPALRGSILVDMIELAEPRFAVCEPEWRDRLSEASASLPILMLDELDNTVMTEWRSEAAGPIADDPEALSFIMFTSGTTGRSKGVMWSSMTINCMAHALADMMEYGEDDRLHTSLPMFHGNALILSIYNALTLGATTVVSRKFSASGFASEVETSRATATSFLGSMTSMVLGRTPDRPFAGSLRKALVIPAPQATIDELERRFGCRVATAYGLADAGLPLFSGLDFPPNACGRTYDAFWEGCIVDADGKEMPRGSVGELAVRPREPFVSALGYWRMPDATETSRFDGWIRTGDLMRQDEEGWFYFVDRGKDSIRRRGENVSSQEVESVFERHPDVLECAAYPVPSEMSEDEIMLAVVLRPGSEVSAIDLIRFAEPKLPYFAIPRFIRFMDQLPKNTMAKVLKAELRKAGVVPGSFDLAGSSHEVKR